MSFNPKKTIVMMLAAACIGLPVHAAAVVEKSPRKTPVTVAVIDGGFDLSHPYLRPFVWQNPKEQSANGRDNDGNGLVNDFHGWNFLGNASGENIVRTGTADYRAWKRLRLRHLAGETLTDAEQARMDSLAKVIHIDSYIFYARNVEAYWKSFQIIDSLMHRQYGDMSATLADFKKLDIEDTTGLSEPIQTVLMRTLQYTNETAWTTILEKHRLDAETAAKRMEQLNSDDDAHRHIGNAPDDLSDFTYGNAILSVDNEDSFHGTMVMGLVAQTAEQFGADIRILPIRAIPDGDEYDRDVAAALKYAIDHGARVINMSFGKRISEHRALVDSLLDETARHDILLVKASGNDSRDDDAVTYYPSPLTIDGHRRDNMLVVGAAGSDGQMMRLSNYGRQTVDVLALGQDVRSTAPADEWSVNNGTSLATPIVAGLAAAIRDANPALTAAQVRDIIMQTSTPLDSTPIAAGRVDMQRAFETAKKQMPFNYDELYHEILNRYAGATWLDDDDRQFFFKKEVRSADGTIVKENWLGDTRKRKIERVDSVMRPHRRYRGFDHNREYWKQYSADSMCYIYAHGHNLVLAHTQRTDSGLVTRDTVPLTSDGQQFYSFSISGNTMRGNRGKSSPFGKWIGNTHSYIVIREDKRDVPTLTYVDNLAEPRPVAHTMKYSMPGDTAVSKFPVYLFDADSLSGIQLDIKAYDDQMIDMPRFRSITTAGNYAYLLRKSRPQDQLDLLRIDPVKKEVRVLIHEDCKPHYNETLFGWHVLNEGRDILWWAERGDRGQWFLYDGEGRLKNAITPPTMVAGEIERIDTLHRTIILKGYGYERDAANPAYTYYYRVGFDGKGLTLLTPGNGDHRIEWSPAGHYFTDTYSRIDFPGATCVRDLKGKLVADLGTADASALTAKGWRPAQQIQLLAADGKTPIYGIVYTPWNMKPGDRLPIISNPYPGPHTDQLPLDFTLDDNGNQTLANDGFIVINYSYPGSNPWRGRAFYTHGYGDFRDYALDDDYAAICQIAALIPQADTTRVGIYGHSGGGFMATAAMLTRPDFYKVGVAASGNHDNNIYLKWWGETFSGVHQVTDSLGHKHWDAHVPTTMELAPNLKGNLLLIHGDVDNNVHPASTLRMAHALIKAGKRFDMLMIPGADHGLGDPYYMQTIRAYFREHLLGQKVPIDLFQ